MLKKGRVRNMYWMGLNFYTVLCIVSVIICAAGMAFYVTVNIINKSNNIGDTSGSFWDYAHNFDSIAKRYDIGKDSARAFLIEYGDSGFDNDDSKAHAALRMNEEDDIFGELEDVDIPLFKPKQG